jgi:hypothetical protein
VGAGQHRQLGVLVGQLDEAVDDLVEGRQQHAIAAVAQHQRVGDVVDVFGGAAEVDELGDAGDFGVVAEALLEPVLHGLHVVVGGGLDGLHGLAVGDREVGDHGVELGHGGRREGAISASSGAAARAFSHSISTLTRLRIRPNSEVLAQRGNLGFVAAVEGRQRGDGLQVHGESP